MWFENVYDKIIVGVTVCVPGGEFLLLWHRFYEDVIGILIVDNE